MPWQQFSFGHGPAKTMREYVREKLREFAERQKLKRKRRLLAKRVAEQERLRLE